MVDRVLAEREGVVTVRLDPEAEHPVGGQRRVTARKIGDQRVAEDGVENGSPAGGQRRQACRVVVDAEGERRIRTRVEQARHRAHRGRGLAGDIAGAAGDPVRQAVLVHRERDLPGANRRTVVVDGALDGTGAGNDAVAICVGRLGEGAEVERAVILGVVDRVVDRVLAEREGVVTVRLDPEAEHPVGGQRRVTARKIGDQRVAEDGVENGSPAGGQRRQACRVVVDAEGERRIRTRVEQARHRAHRGRGLAGDIAGAAGDPVRQAVLVHRERDLPGANRRAVIVDGDVDLADRYATRTRRSVLDIDVDVWFFGDGRIAHGVIHGSIQREGVGVWEIWRDREVECRRGNRLRQASGIGGGVQGIGRCVDVVVEIVATTGHLNAVLVEHVFAGHMIEPDSRAGRNREAASELDLIIIACDHVTVADARNVIFVCDQEHVLSVRRRQHCVGRERAVLISDRGQNVIDEQARDARVIG